jgi:post-segregation antitoxin (ccd killing protein)
MGVLRMKTKLTVTIDEELVPLAKQYASARGVSLSQLIETALRQISSDKRSSFSKRWRGKFRAASRDDARYRALEKKYL